MISIKRNISFSVETKNKADTEGRLRCIVTWDSQRVRLSLGHAVTVMGWERALQRCKARTTHAKYRTPAAVVNHDIDNMEILINGIFTAFEHQDKIPSKDEFLAEYSRLTTPDVKANDETESVGIADRPLFPIYDEFVKDGTTSGRWSEGTLVKTRTIRKHLMAISETLSMNDIIKGGLTTLIEYFGKVPDNTKKTGLANTTIKNDIAFVKVFMRWAQEHGYCDASPFLNTRIKLKTANKPVIYLTWDELMTVYNFDFGHRNYLAHVRDVFCFCCFTSLRYSDAHNLRRSNISDTEIKITTIKTHDSLTIELNKYSRAILDKYKDVQFPNDKALPVISNQRMNDYLKLMGKACGLTAPITITQYKGTKRYDTTYEKWELLSTHCGRRTFVCNALMLGIPANIVMQWTGHSDYATMRPYIAIADSARRSAMTAFDRTINVGQNVGQKNENG